MASPEPEILPAAVASATRPESTPHNVISSETKKKAEGFEELSFSSRVVGFLVICGGIIAALAGASGSLCVAVVSWGAAIFFGGYFALLLAQLFYIRALLERK